MPQRANITRAELREIGWNEDWEPVEVPGGASLPVQFNPQSLRVSYANQMSGGDQRGGSAIQFVGRGSTRLAVELLFDVTAPLAGEMQPEQDVRLLTRAVARFMMATDEREPGRFVPPGVRMVWGSFIFEGVMDSMTETLDLFSHDGRPLRATVAVTMVRQDVFFPEVNASASNAASPRLPAGDGDSAQSIASGLGRPDDWRGIADLNGIENPRFLTPGAMIRLPPAGVRATAGVGGRAGISARAGAGGSLGGGASARVGG